ncbi:DUF1405 domain-containing protein [Gorillibacterium timonense]|uniref:DUF1405 domain-containing protein n=1 Tax=Gorillibacterium timonense TaxID=1689269 RepID=UPI00071C4913|nr:DUF1405 domain-containing protein [Gorillibacterium timonense]
MRRLWSWVRIVLISRTMLWTLFVINLLGTIYGYYWYGAQLVDVSETKPLWMLILVPDSPTGSFFFTLALIGLLIDSYRRGDGTVGNRLAPTSNGMKRLTVRSAIEALACAASFKYGIWAVAIIVVSDLAGSPNSWVDVMLSVSHLGMAFEAVLFARYFRLDERSLAIGAIWLYASDLVDYTFGVYPNLSDVLLDSVPAVAAWTTLLSSLTIYLFWRLGKKKPDLLS